MHILVSIGGDLAPLPPPNNVRPCSLPSTRQLFSINFAQLRLSALTHKMRRSGVERRGTMISLWKLAFQRVQNAHQMQAVCSRRGMRLLASSEQLVVTLPNQEPIADLAMACVNPAHTCHEF